MSIPVSELRPSTAAPAFLPSPIRVSNNKGEITSYFLQNNPWKLCNDRSCWKFYRYCLNCGEDRFGEDLWRREIHHMWGRPPLSCEKEVCRLALAKLPETIWKKHCVFMGENPDFAVQHEQFERVDDV